MNGMEIALREGRAALEEGEIPVGAALFLGERLICSDHNRREQLHDPTAHAELLCLREGGRILGDWRLTDCTLYVTLEPCPMCAGAMVMSRLGNCVFGTGDPEAGCCGSVYDLPADPALHGRTRWQQDQAAEAACRELLRAFFRKKRDPETDKR